jgi:ATP-binding protein involved in chromosome partitioning
MKSALPHAITRDDAGLIIAWLPAGHEALYPARELRLACRCAACVEEMSGRPLLDPATVAADVRPVSVALVGGYGVRIRWSDGHDTGIYTFDQLRAACPCAACAAA